MAQSLAPDQAQPNVEHKLDQKILQKFSEDDISKRRVKIVKSTPHFLLCLYILQVVMI